MEQQPQEQEKVKYSAKKIEASEVQIGELIVETHNGNTKIFRAIYNKKEYIAKGILKDSIETQEQLQHIFSERDAMQACNEHPLLNKIIATFKDDKYLYLLLEFVEGLPLHKILQMHPSLTDKFCQFVIYQLVLQIQVLHEQGYVYRDIKASNLIINKRGQVRLIDFGFCKKIGKERTKSFCGTLHAMAPEFFDVKVMQPQEEGDIKEGTGYSYEVDYYAIGIFLFEILIGKPPFGYEPSQQLIQSGLDNDIMSNIKDQTTRQFIEQLMSVNVEKRLGYKNGIQEIINHEYFKNLDKQSIQNLIYDKNYQIDQFQLDIQFYHDDIEAFGLYKQEKEEEISQEDKEIMESQEMKKLNNIFEM